MKSAAARLLHPIRCFTYPKQTASLQDCLNTFSPLPAFTLSGPQRHLRLPPTLPPAAAASQKPQTVLWSEYVSDWRVWVGAAGLAVGSWLAYDMLRVRECTSFAFLDIAVANGPSGRVVVGLFGKENPITVKNFLGLVDHEKGFGYRGSPIHKVVKDFVVMGGDIVRGSGSGGVSIYGPHFSAENRNTVKHQRGTISMVVEDGDSAVRSQFFITLMPVPGLDKVMVPFGRVTSGLELLDQISRLPTNNHQEPLQRVVITDCGSCPPGAQFGGCNAPPPLVVEGSMGARSSGANDVLVAPAR